MSRRQEASYLERSAIPEIPQLLVDDGGTLIFDVGLSLNSMRIARSSRGMIFFEEHCHTLKR